MCSLNRRLEVWLRKESVCAKVLTNEDDQRGKETGSARIAPTSDTSLAGSAGFVGGGSEGED